MAYQRMYTLSVILLLMLGFEVESAPQESPFQPGPFGVPFPAGNTTTLSPTGSAGVPKASGASNANASMCQVQQVGLGPIDGGPPNPNVYSTACSCSNLYSAHASTLTSTFQNRIGPVTETLTTFADASYRPPDDCCIKCWVSAMEVQVIYWPIQTAATNPNNDTASTGKWNATSSLPPNPTITAAPTPYSVVTDGFTFVSPSVYVAYRDLQAYAVCPSFGNAYPRGRSYNTTIAYAPDQLSTSICTTGLQEIKPVGYGHFAAINYTEYQYSTSAWSQCAKEIEAGSGGSRSIEGPFYSIPGDVSLIDPAWHTCSAVFNGVFDPPRLLNPAPALAMGSVGDPGPALQTAAPAMKAPAPALISPTPGPLPNDPAPSNPPASDPAPPSNPTVEPPPANKSPTNNPPTNGEPAAVHEDSPSQQGVNLPQPAQAGPTPTPAALIMNTPAPPPPITANGVTISRVPAGTEPGNGEDASGNGGGTNGGESAGNNVGNSGFAGNSGANAGNSGANAGNSDANAGNSGANASNAKGVVVSGTTYSNGASTTLPSGETLSVASDHVLLGGSSYALPPAASPSPLMIAGNPISKAANGGLVIGTSTITPDTSPTTAYGHLISLGQSSAVIDGSTYALPPAQSYAPTSTSAITLSNGDVLTAGGAPAIVSDTTVALASNGASLVINGHSFSIPPASSGGISSSNTLVTIGGQTFTAASAGFEIGSQTITPGGTPITVSGTVVSLGPSGRLVIGSETTTLPSGGSGIAEIVGGIAINAPMATGMGGGPGATAQAFTGSGVRSCLISPRLLIIITLGVFLF